MAGWRAEIVQQFQSEISIHFAAEEEVLFPVARKFRELIPVIEELLADHGALREFFAKAGASNMSAAELSEFGQRMSAHIRKEERQFFERLQQLMGANELSLLGQRLDEALRDAAQACMLPADRAKAHPTN